MLMKTFDTLALRLTPLTPIHVGCGEDFEPTNYVIDGGVLYRFDPAQVSLSAPDRRALLEALRASGGTALRQVQRFFHERSARYAAMASQVVAVAPGVAEQYQRRVGQVAQSVAPGRDVTNQLEIERSAHHPHTGVPYLPGSSLKGAMRTAWLDRINQGAPRRIDEKATDLEKRLLQGSFATDALRLLRLSDATGEDVLAQVVFSTNHKKRQVFRDGEELSGQGPAARREVIVGGQYAALRADLRFELLPGQHDGAKVPHGAGRPDWLTLAQACNRYYAPRLEREIALLSERGFAHPNWLRAMHELHDSLRPARERGDALLLRVGRHSGATSVTLDGVRQIKVRLGPGQQEVREDSTTLWLAAEHEHDTRGALLPFGWLLVERAQAPQIEALQQWCAAQPKPDLRQVREHLAKARREAEETARTEGRLKAEQAQAAEGQRQAAEKERQRLASLSPREQDIEQLAAALRARATPAGGRKDKPNTELHARARALARRALDEGWSMVERAALAGVLEQWLPQAVAIDWKDERKKLQFTQLRGG